ncbi:glycosyl hydrolase family 28-related protein [Paenibacillus oryzisoli]|uniref:hypothetical protein n=1 Tax=Paenibacillus oryzisoli TaxID=1850517 RepID=UPI003D2E935D
MQAVIFDEYMAKGNQSILPDFSYAGYKYGEEEMPEHLVLIPVSDFGIVPDTGMDVTERIQQLIDTVGKRGGGVLFFPKGRYDLRMDPGKDNYLKMNYSHVVLKGEGSGSDGTVFYQHRPILSEKMPWLSPGIIHTGDALFGNEKFLSPKELPQVATISENAHKGETVLSLSDTSLLKEGDCILLCMRNTDDDGTLIRELIAPLELDPAWEDAHTAGTRRAASYQWLVEIDRVLDERHIRLKQPLRRDVLLACAPFVCRIDMLRGVGIEDLRLESAWDGGGYYHHKNHEVDYGWSGICMHRVAHGWVRNVVMNNYTQGIQLRDSRNVTVCQVEMYGHPGHFGMKCYAHACDNLFADIDIRSFLTHGVGIEGTTQGNVFTDIRFHAAGTEIDSHGGGAPSFNLFENMVGVSKISGGGAIFNLPYTGQYNTFWNLRYTHSEPKPGWNTYGDARSKTETLLLKKERRDELFYAWYWSCHMGIDTLQDHRMYPKSIVVGAFASDPGEEVKVERSTYNRSDDWGYVEALNHGPIAPLSVYAAQLELRLKTRH